MDIERAKQIADSSIWADVSLNGEPIYIEGINETRNSANIHFLDDPKKTQEVSLDSLIEH